MKKETLLKGTSWICFLSILFQTFYPTISSAVTSGPTQPEIYGYQPVDATDNVNLANGSFNYTIPVTSIPEYPMAISYGAGLSMDQEASMFGLGFNGFTGAISRNMVGLPDDINTGTKTYNYSNQPQWDAAAKFTYSVGIGNDYYSAGASVFAKLGFDNYKGVFGALGLKLGVEGKIGRRVSAAGGINGTILTDSRVDGFIYGAGADLGFKALSLRLNGQAFVGGVTGYNGSSFSGLSTSLGFGVETFNNRNSDGGGIALSQPVILPSAKSISLTVPIPIPTVNVTAEYNRNESLNGTVQKTVKGFMYLNNYDRSKNDQVADFSIEGESSFDSKFRNSPAYLQRDYFMINCMGLGGSMQLFQPSYGVVSRNYQRSTNRDIGFVSLGTTRKEVYPWVNVVQSRLNKSVDLIKLIKTGDKTENDIDNVIFEEVERVNLNDQEHRFRGEPKFKLRGDLAGQFDLSSASYKDEDVNVYSLVHVEGASDDVKFFLLGGEKEMPLYYPKANETAHFNYNRTSNKVERGTDIRYYKVGDILSQYEKNKKDAPGLVSKMPVSFYSHEKYTGTISKKQTESIRNHLSTFNILDHLTALKASQSSVAEVIGSVEVRNAQGLKYIFGLPVFNKTTKNLSLAGRGVKPPNIFESDYNSFESNNRYKLSQEDNYMYPYAWLLTAVVGEDYIDFDDIPGPSDGDLGYWVKFKYVKGADDYQWRTPFTGLDHLPGALHKADDDFYAMSAGIKEVYYVSEIESPGYTAKYDLHKRFDGGEAAGVVNGQAYNSLSSSSYGTSTTDPTGQDFPFAVTRIDLYKKHPQGLNSNMISPTEPYGKPVRSTRFYYDYSQCKKVINNCQNYGEKTLKSAVPYYYIDPETTYNDPDQYVGTGKLTLKRVQHIAWDEQGNEVTLPSYEFRYGDDNRFTGPKTKYNPYYDERQFDKWGNFTRRSAGIGNNNLKYYSHYTELDKDSADVNASVFSIRRIDLPTGGNLEINYQAKSYGYVEDKRPYVMRHVKDPITVIDGHKIKVKVDITDLAKDGKNLSQVLATGSTTYGELAFYQITNPSRSAEALKEHKLFLSVEEPVVESFGAISDMESDGKVYQEVTLSDPNRKPFIGSFLEYMYTGSPEMRGVKESFNVNCAGVSEVIRRYETLQLDDPFTAINKVISNVRSAFLPASTFETAFRGCYANGSETYGTRIFSHLSFLRTQAYKGVYTGSAVKSLIYRDAFQYATKPSESSGRGAEDNVYGTAYYQDVDGTGKGISSGVATIEPGGGKSAVIDLYQRTGAGFTTAPSITFARSTVETMYKDVDDGLKTEISRAKGKTVYEFYTSKDAGLKFNDGFHQQEFSNPGKPFGIFYMYGLWQWYTIRFKIFTKKVLIEIPYFIPMVIEWNRHDEYHLKSYSYADHLDLIGRPKAIVQQSVTGKVVGSQKYSYFDSRQGDIKVYKDNFTAPTNVKAPGKMDQVWSEAYFTKENEISFTPWILFLHGSTKRHLTYTNMKYSYYPPVLKEITSEVDGMITKTEYSGFDYYTGTPIEVRSNDSYGNTKIKRTVPAYWKYPEMGPSANQVIPTNLNMLTATAESYMYLNEVDNTHILGAGVTEWSKSAYGFVDYLQPKKTGSQTFVYDKIAGYIIKKQMSKLYKPIKSYTYETELIQDGALKGTFKTFTDFSVNKKKWKLVSTNEYFDAGGNLVQSKDILGKYAAQHIGYNNSHAISTVANATWGGSWFEGAENSYKKANGQVMLEGDRVLLGDAQVIKGECEAVYSSHYLTSTSFKKGSVYQSERITIGCPASVQYNMPFAKLDVVYSNGIKRSLFLSRSDDGKYALISDRGESFTGFLTEPENANQLILNPTDFSSLKVDPNYNKGGCVNISFSNKVTDCIVAKKYTIPENDCIAASHTGKYAFMLPAGKSGTSFVLSMADAATRTDFHRKYTAMVWVYDISPKDKTELVAVITGSKGTQTITQTAAQPYAVSGKWSLIRSDFDLTRTDLSTATISVKNSSTNGTVVYDDLRILPFHSVMNNTVYDHRFDRVMAGLDENNFANYYQYDARGRVATTKVEVQNVGKETTKKYLYNDQKKY